MWLDATTLGWACHIGSFASVLVWFLTKYLTMTNWCLPSLPPCTAHRSVRLWESFVVFCGFGGSCFLQHAFQASPLLWFTDVAWILSCCVLLMLLPRRPELLCWPPAQSCTAPKLVPVRRTLRHCTPITISSYSQFRNPQCWRCSRCPCVHHSQSGRLLLVEAFKKFICMW
jgi:hypothetical protein